MIVIISITDLIEVDIWGTQDVEFPRTILWLCILDVCGLDMWKYDIGVVPMDYALCHDRMIMRRTDKCFVPVLRINE